VRLDESDVDDREGGERVFGLLVIVRPLRLSVAGDHVPVERQRLGNTGLLSHHLCRSDRAGNAEGLRIDGGTKRLPHDLWPPELHPCRRLRPCQSDAFQLVDQLEQRGRIGRDETLLVAFPQGHDGGRRQPSPSVKGRHPVATGEEQCECDEVVSHKGGSVLIAGPYSTRSTERFAGDFAARYVVLLLTISTEEAWNKVLARVPAL
jgi:hypothetical protein